MMIRRLITLSVLLAAALAAPIASAQRIDDRIDRADRRIEQGIRSGSLSRREAERLRDELQSIRRDERVLRADGRGRFVLRHDRTAERLLGDRRDRELDFQFFPLSRRVAGPIE